MFNFLVLDGELLLEKIKGVLHLIKAALVHLMPGLL